MARTIELRRISKTFHSEHAAVPALEAVSLRVEAHEFVTIIGPSGSGKSTIFNIAAGLLEPDTGQVLIDGEPRNREAPLGYMPQRDLLLPWRSVLRNATLPQELAGRRLSHAEAEARELLPAFGLEGFEDRYPLALSGGMRQRAALLRTVMTGSDVLLLDEPFGALDALTRREMQDWVLEVHRKLRRTVLFITHDVDEAVYLADRVVVLSPRPGRVAAEHTVDLPRPRRQGMTATPEFGSLVARMLTELGLEHS
jgi:ABC-type nitrate/sulfonate/bicarbonate transport system ATPase subunit